MIKKPTNTYIINKVRHVWWLEKYVITYIDQYNFIIRTIKKCANHNIEIIIIHSDNLKSALDI